MGAERKWDILSFLNEISARPGKLSKIAAEIGMLERTGHCPRKYLGALEAGLR